MARALWIVVAAGVAVPLILALAQETPPPAGDPAPADAKKECSSCHAKPEIGDQWGAWTSSAHARAFAALSSEKAAMAAKRAGVEGNPAEAEMCLSCHAPTAGLREMGVTCHACHGEGDDYAGVCGTSFAEAVEKGMRLSGEKECIACHRASTAHPNLEFLFHLDIDAVAHPVPRREEEEGASLFSTKGVYTKWEVFSEEDGLPHHIVFGVTPHGDDVWFATEDGVARLRDGKFKVWHEEQGLPHQAATQIAVDRESGEVWASTLCGVARYLPKEDRWEAFHEEDGLINNCAFGITIFEEDVWVATFDGIARYDRETKQWKKYYLDNAPLEEVWTYGTEADHEKVNFAVWGGGLVEYFPAEDHWEAHHDPDGSFEMDLVQGDGVVSQMTTSVSHDNGWTWVASYFGMCGFNGRTWLEMDMDNSGMPSNFVNFVKARRYEGWFCLDRGLACYDHERGRWVWYKKLGGPGTYGEIEIISADGKKRRSFRTKTSIPMNFVWGVAFQGEDVWVATSDGVARGRY